MDKFVVAQEIRSVFLENQEKVIYIKEMGELVYGMKYFGHHTKEKIKELKSTININMEKYMFKYYGVILVPVKDEVTHMIEGWKISSNPNDEDIRAHRQDKMKRANTYALSAARVDDSLVGAGLLSPKHAFKHDILFELSPSEVIKQLN